MRNKAENYVERNMINNKFIVCEKRHRLRDYEIEENLKSLSVEKARELIMKNINKLKVEIGLK